LAELLADGLPVFAHPRNIKTIVNIYGAYVAMFCCMRQVTSLKIKYNPFAKAFQDNKERSDDVHGISYCFTAIVVL